MGMDKNLGNIMKEAQKMQQRMQEAHESLVKLEVIGESGGGRVKIKMNGRHDVLNVYIDPNLIDDLEMLEDLIAAAINDAVRKIEKASKEKISQLTAGLKLPTDFTKEEGEGGKEGKG